MVDTSRQVNLGGNDVTVNSIMYAGNAVTQPCRIINGNGSAPISVTTTTSTYTAANMATGIIVNSAASAVTATLDSATNVVAYLNANYSGAQIGDMIVFELINGGNTSGAITVSPGSGGTLDTNVPTANKTVAINTAKTVIIRVTAIGTPAYVMYI